MGTCTQLASTQAQLCRPCPLPQLSAVPDNGGGTAAGLLCAAWTERTGAGQISRAGHGGEKGVLVWSFTQTLSAAVAAPRGRREHLRSPGELGTQVLFRLVSTSCALRHVFATLNLEDSQRLQRKRLGSPSSQTTFPYSKGRGSGHGDVRPGERSFPSLSGSKLSRRDLRSSRVAARRLPGQAFSPRTAS